MIFSLVSIYDKKLDAYSNVQTLKYDLKELKELYVRDFKGIYLTDKEPLYVGKVVIYLGSFDDSKADIHLDRKLVLDFDDLKASLDNIKKVGENDVSKKN